MAGEIAKLFVTLGINDSGLQTGLKNLQKNMTAVGKEMTVIGTTITAAMGAAVYSFTKAGAAINDMSKKTGMSTETLSALKFAADSTGSSIEGLEIAVKLMSKGIGEGMLTGKGQFVDAMKAIGLSMDDLIGKNPDQQFMLIARALSNVHNPAMQADMALKIFGRSGTDMLPMLADGADGLDKLMQKAKDLGVVFSKDGAESAETLSRALASVKASVQGLANEIGSTLAPVITDAVANITNIIKSITDWAKAHPELAKNLTIITAGVGALLAQLGPLLITLPLLAAGFQILLGPAGWVILAIEALAAAAIFLILNWAKVKLFFSDLWDLIKVIFANAVKFISNTVLLPFIEFYGKIFGTLAEGIGKIVGIFNKDLGKSIEDFGSKMVNARQEINKWSDAIVDSSRDAVTARQMQFDLANAAKESADKMTTNVKNYTATAKQSASSLADVQIAAINKALTAAQTSHDQKMKDLQSEYDATVKNIDASMGIILSGMDNQITAIEKQKQANADAITERQNQEKIATLTSQINAEKDVDRKKELQKELDDFLQQIADDKVARELDDQIITLRAAQDNVRQSATDAKTAAENKLNDAKTAADTELKDFQDSENAKITQINTTLNATLAAYDADEKAFNTLLADKTKSMEEYVAAYNTLVGQMVSSGSIPAPAPSTPGGSMFTPPFINAYPSPGKSIGLNPVPIPKMALGGIAMSPMAAIIGERGPEAVIPMDKLGNGGAGGQVNHITIHVAGSVRTDRELLAFVHEGLLVGNRSNAHLGFS